MELLPSNFQDIRKYYGETYVKLQEFGDTIFFIRKVTEDAVFFIDKDNKEGIIYLHEEEPYTLMPSMPNKTLFQIGVNCYYVSRHPARQYSRGITSQNCQAMRFSLDGWQNTEIGFTLLEGYTNKPKFPSIKEVLTPANKYIAGALSSRFCLSRIGRLYCDTKYIGNVLPEGKIALHTKIFANEIQQLLLTTCMSEFYQLKE